MQDIGGFNHTVLARVLMLVKELHRLREFSFLDQASQLGLSRAIRSLAIIKCEDLGGARLNRRVIFLSHSLGKFSVGVAQLLSLVLC